MKAPPREPRAKLRDATQDEPHALPPPEAEPAPPPPAAVKFTEDDIAPLWDDRAESDGKNFMLKSEFVKTHVYRLVAEAGSKHRRDFTLELPPEATISDLARMRGGGRYHLAAMSPKNTPVAWKVLTIEGPPAQLSSPILGNSDPIMETALGMVGIKGLDPMAQFAWAFMQGYTAQVREDARFLINSYVQTVGNLANARTPAAAAQHEFIGFMQRQIADRDAQVDEMRRELRKIAAHAEDLRVEVHKLRHDKPDGAFNEALASAMPVMAEKAGGAIEKVIDAMTGNSK